MQPGWQNWWVEFHDQPLEQAFSKDAANLTYLTADAEGELTALEGRNGYIIGGVVDRNRHKNHCLEKAERLGIASARLPIGDHLKMAGSQACPHVRTVGAWL
jgi:tRNA (guanine9-N1)-methyltransferase